MGNSNRSDIIEGGGPRPFIMGLLLVLAVAFIASLLTGCVSENDVPAPGPGEGVSAPIVVKAGSELAASPATRATDDKWGAAENIGVFAKNTSDGTYVHENVKHTYSGTAGQTEVTFTPPEGVEMRYEEGKPLEFHAYAPYSDTPDAIAIDSSKDCFTSDADLMYASGAVGALKSGDTKSPSVVFDGEADADQTDQEAHGTKFKHVMSKVVVKIKPGKGLSADVIKDCKLWLDGIYAQPLTWNAKTNTFSVTGKYLMGRDKIQVLGEGKIEKDGKSVGLSATADADGYYTTDAIYLVPCYLSMSQIAMFVIIQPKDCEEMRAKFSISGNRFESGKSYELKVTANLTELEVGGCTISDWETVKYAGDLDGDATELKDNIGNSGNDYSPTEIGDLMFADGTTRTASAYARLNESARAAWDASHGKPVGIVSVLYKDDGIILRPGVAGYLQGKGVTPHGLVMSLKQGSGTWSNPAAVQVGQMYGSASAAYTSEVDGMGFLSQTYNGKTVMEYVAANENFQIFCWCRNELNNGYDHARWMDSKTTGWYLPSYSEWVYIWSSWMKATPGFDNCDQLITWLKQIAPFTFGMSDSSGFAKLGETVDLVNQWMQCSGSDVDALGTSNYATTTQANTQIDRVVLIGYGKNSSNVPVLRTGHTYKHYPLSVRAVFAF